MAIVRADKRPEAIEAFAQIRMGLNVILSAVDQLLLKCETVERDLGLATEAEQTKRELFAVMHYPQGEDDSDGHFLSECETLGCDLQTLGNSAENLLEEIAASINGKPPNLAAEAADLLDSNEDGVGNR